MFTGLAGIGGALGGHIAFFAERPEAPALFLDSLTFLFSAWMVRGLALRRPLRRPRQVGGQKSRALAEFAEGVRFLCGHAVARAMTVGIVFAFAGAGSVIALGPIFAKQVLGAGPEGWGVLVTSLGIGMAAGMLSVRLVGRMVDRQILFTTSMISAALVLLILSAMPSLASAAVVTLLMGIGAGVTWVSGYTLLHENVTDDLRGRTFGSLAVLVRLGLFLALAGFPALSQVFGNPVLSLGDTDIRVAGARLALVAGAMVILVGGLLSRGGLARSRLARPRPLRLHPRIQRIDKRGPLIVFEGVDGRSKNAQVELAREFLEEEGYDVLVTEEPGGTELGQRLQRILRAPEGEPIDNRAEALVFAAGRAQHVARVLRPALEEGNVVLCDGYVDSSLAYDGAGRGLSEQDVLSLNVWATQGLVPDLAILLNRNPDRRLQGPSHQENRAGNEALELQPRVADAFLRIAEDHPERFVIIDADARPDLVHGRVREALTGYLRRGDGS